MHSALLQRTYKYNFLVFKEMFLKDVADFKEHTEHVANQFREVKNLKENLPNGHVIVQMDFTDLLC
jgi:hypothetical protein